MATNNEELVGILGSPPAEPKEQKVKGEAPHIFTPYYTALAAKDVIPILQMLLDHRNNIVPKDTPIDGYLDKLQPLYIRYCTTSLAPRTLHTKVLNSWKWLCDHVDKDGEYKTLRNQISIKLCREFLVMTWKAPNFYKNGTTIGASIAPERDLMWRDSIREWLDHFEEANQEPLELTKLELLPEDITWLRNFLDPIGVLYKITDNHTIRIVK